MSLMFWSFATVSGFPFPLHVLSSSLRKSLSASAVEISNSNSLPVGEGARRGISVGVGGGGGGNFWWRFEWETFFFSAVWWGNPGPEAEASVG